jgi:hypothetical protein
MEIIIRPDAAAAADFVARIIAKELQVRPRPV